MSVRIKLILGFLIPSLMILMVGFWNSYQIRTLSRGVEDILHNNDRSIQYALNMNDAVSNIDKALLQKIKGDFTAFDSILPKEKSIFDDNFREAENNITEKGEDSLLVSLKSSSDLLFQKIDSLPSNTDFAGYLAEFFPLYELTQAKIDSLRLMNYRALYTNAMKLVTQSRVVALPGDVLVVVALLFFFLFAWLTYRYIAAPVNQILNAVKKFNTSGDYRPPALDNNDELRDLAEELKTALKK